MWKELLIKLAFQALLALSQDAIQNLQKYAVRKCNEAVESTDFRFWCAVSDFLEVLFIRKGEKEVV